VTCKIPWLPLPLLFFLFFKLLASLYRLLKRFITLFKRDNLLCLNNPSEAALLCRLKQ
jgi:hypothetical protein